MGTKRPEENKASVSGKKPRYLSLAHDKSDGSENINKTESHGITIINQSQNTEVIPNRPKINVNDAENTENKENHVTSSIDGIEFIKDTKSHITNSRNDKSNEPLKTNCTLSSDEATNTDRINGHEKITRDHKINMHGNTRESYFEDIDSTKIHQNISCDKNLIIDSSEKTNTTNGDHKRRNFRDDECRYLSNVFEEIGIIDTEAHKYLNFYSKKEYVPDNIEILHNGIYAKLEKEQTLSFDPNTDIQLTPHFVHGRFERDKIKACLKQKSPYSVPTGDANIKSLNLTVHKLKETTFTCTVVVELNLSFQLFKYITEANTVQVTRNDNGTLSVDNILLLNLPNVKAKLEFIQFFGTIGVTKKKETQERYIFMKYNKNLIYKMSLFDFYMRFDSVIGEWPWNDGNNKPQNPPHGDIVTYTIPKNEKNKSSDGRKGLIDLASENFANRCLYYFTGKHEVIETHATNYSDTTIVAEGTLVLAKVISESIRNHKTVLINLINYKLDVINKLDAEYLRKHPMLFAGSWPKRKETGFNFVPKKNSITLERENYWFDQLRENHMDIQTIVLEYIFDKEVL